MSRFAPSTERKPSEVPSGAYNGICSRLEDTGVLEPEGKEFLESPVSRAGLEPTSCIAKTEFTRQQRKLSFRLQGPLRCLKAAVARSGRAGNRRRLAISDH